MVDADKSCWLLGELVVQFRRLAARRAAGCWASLSYDTICRLDAESCWLLRELVV
jgi:hypothetical protein